MRYRSQSVRISRYTVLGVLFTVSVGTLLHYVFDWTHQNRIVAFLVPVNESVWEHLKMLVVPILLYSIFESLMLGSELTNFIIAKAVSILAGMYSLLSLYYTYTGIIGKNNSITDIVIFVISVIVAYVISYVILNGKKLKNGIFQSIGMFLIVAIIICFMWFSYFPPKIKLFYDPVMKGFGF